MLGECQHTKISTFLLSGRFACALMIFFSVPRGYSVCGIFVAGRGFTACASVKRFVSCCGMAVGVDVGVDVAGRARRVHWAGLAGRCAVSHVHTYKGHRACPPLPLKLHSYILIGRLL